MMRPRSLGWLLPLILVVVLLPGCSDAVDEIAGTTLASAATESTSSATTTAPGTTATPPTTSSTTVAEAVVQLPGPGEPWDLLYFNHYDLFTGLPAELYVERAVEALGVDVGMTHPEGFNHLYASNQLAHLRDERYPLLGEAAQDAEIIVVLTRQDPIHEGPMGRINDDFERCTWEISPGNPPGERPADYWDPYRQLMDDIYAEIWTLRQGLPTVLISIDFHMLDLTALREAEILEECVEWWEEWSNQIRETAAIHGSTMVSIFDLFNGPDHDIDPTDLGLIGPTDENPSNAPYRVNPAGAILIADALAATGFEPASQP